LKFQIDLSDSDQRLDKWIKRKFLKVPQSLLEKCCRKGQIKLNGKNTKLSYKIKVGDFIETPSFKSKKRIKANINKNDLRILKKKIINNIIYKDNDKIIINKPSGVAVHRGTKTLLSICDLLDELQFDSKEKPRIVHRIDKETSGLLIIARTYKSSVYFSKEFNKKKIEKFYIAILNGIPKKNEGRMVNQIKDDKNKTSITRYIILRKIEKKFSFILLKPETGKKRQIRKHCFQLGCPIVGDKKFLKKLDGNKNIKYNKLFLHAYKLKIKSLDNKKEDFTAPLPNHIIKFLYSHNVYIKENCINKFVKSDILKGVKKLKN